MYYKPRVTRGGFAGLVATLFLASTDYVEADQRRLPVPDCLISNDCWSDGRGEHEAAWDRPADLPEADSGKDLQPSLPQTLSSLADLEAEIAARQEARAHCAEQNPSPNALENPTDPEVGERAYRYIGCFLSGAQVEEIRRYPEDNIEDTATSSEWNHFLMRPSTQRCSYAITLLQQNQAKLIKLEAEAKTTVEGWYVADCFDLPEALPTSISRRVVFLAAPDPAGTQVVFCVGFLVAPERVATAKHCAVDGALIKAYKDRHLEFMVESDDPSISPDPGPGIEIALPPGTYVIAPHDQPSHYDVTIEAASTGTFFPLDPPSDRMVLAVPGLGIGLAPFPVSDPRNGDQLLVFGSLKRQFGLNPRSDELTDAVRVATAADGGNECRINWVGGRDCIAHLCQTIRGFSGSPILTKRDGEPVLIGIHTGFFGAGRNICSFRRATIVVNQGVSIEGLLNQ